MRTKITNFPGKPGVMNLEPKRGGQLVERMLLLRGLDYPAVRDFG